MFAKWIDEDGRFAFDDEDNGGFELSMQQYDALITGQSEGKVIRRGPGGRPALFDPAEETDEQKRANVLAARSYAYRLESDPIKNEIDYDAAISGEKPDYAPWISKVTEIKERYPLP